MQFGFGMDGMEGRIAATTHAVAAKFDEVTYVEIGVAHGITLTAVSSLLRDYGKKWRAIGIELPNGYDFSHERTVEVAAVRKLKLDFVIPNGNVQRPQWGQITVFLKDSQTFLTELWQDSIEFALIDGCHGRPCVVLDFLAIEAFMSTGGVVMFHDFAEDQVGLYQPHCPTGVDVRGAVRELGLMNGARKGWQFTEVMKANRAAGAWDMGVFQKVGAENA